MARNLTFFFLISLAASWALALDPLKIGLVDRPPFAWKENGRFRGFHAVMAEGLAAKLGRPLKLELYPIRRLVDMAKEGDVDLVFMTDQAAFQNTSMKKAFLMDVTTRIFMRKSQTLINSVKELKGKVARMADGCANLGPQPNVKWQEMKSYDQCLDILLVGRVDAVCGTEAFQVVVNNRAGAAKKIQSSVIDKKAVWVHGRANMDSDQWNAIDAAVVALVQDGSVRRWLEENSKY
jgi:ABC-type amino acid transport substrate-binding protein